jgi:hypothetical protein
MVKGCVSIPNYTTSCSKQCTTVRKLDLTYVIYFHGFLESEEIGEEECNEGGKRTGK